MTKNTLTNNNRYVISDHKLADHIVSTQPDLPLLKFGSVSLHEEHIEDLVALMDVLRSMPDDHPLAELKQQMQTRKAFNRLEDSAQ
jgi:hypothetical protein